MKCHNLNKMCKIPMPSRKYNNKMVSSEEAYTQAFRSLSGITKPPYINKDLCNFCDVYCINNEITFMSIIAYANTQKSIDILKGYFEINLEKNNFEDCDEWLYKAYKKYPHIIFEVYDLALSFLMCTSHAKHKLPSWFEFYYQFQKYLGDKSKNILLNLF